jgi:hypothetical protein
MGLRCDSVVFVQAAGRGVLKAGPGQNLPAQEAPFGQ